MSTKHFNWYHMLHYLRADETWWNTQRQCRPSREPCHGVQRETSFSNLKYLRLRKSIIKKMPAVTVWQRSKRKGRSVSGSNELRLSNEIETLVLPSYFRFPESRCQPLLRVHGFVARSVVLRSAPSGAPLSLYLTANVHFDVSGSRVKTSFSVFFFFFFQNTATSEDTATGGFH